MFMEDIPEAWLEQFNDRMSAEGVHYAQAGHVHVAVDH